MNTRQSGAAHVPIMFFLFLLIMFLGALFYAYTTETKNGELIKQRNEAQAEAATLRSKALLIEHYVGDVGSVVNKPGKYEGHPESKSIYNGAVIEYAGVMNPSEVKKVIEDACTSARVTPGGSLEAVLGGMVSRVSQMEQRVKDIETERDKALGEKAEIDRKYQQTVADVQKTAREWAQNLEDERSAFAAAKEDATRLNGVLTTNLQNKRDELAKFQEDSAALEKSLRKDIANLRMQNSALVSNMQMRNPIDQADGKVIVARTGVASAFINLGKKDLLIPGTMFRIKNPHNDAVKAYATVMSVEDEKAEVSLSGIVDPVGDYVREGDLLFSELYSPHMTRTIFLMGRFSAPYEKDRLADLLKRLGNKVVSTMGPGVDTVILGDDPVNEAGDGFAVVKDSAEYKEALGLGVEFAPLKKIRDLIKL